MHFLERETTLKIFFMNYLNANSYKRHRSSVIWCFYLIKKERKQYCVFAQFDVTNNRWAACWDPTEIPDLLDLHRYSACHLHCVYLPANALLIKLCQCNNDSHSQKDADTFLLLVFSSWHFLAMTVSTFVDKYETWSIKSTISCSQIILPFAG